MAKVEQEREYDIDSPAQMLEDDFGDFERLGRMGESDIESIDLSNGGKTRKLNLPGASITEHLVD